MPEAPKDNDDAWLDELSGRTRTPDADPDTRAASMLGRLIRARFNSALQDVRAQPASDLTRARLLAHARAYRPARSRWRLPLAVGGGIAAGVIAAALWFQIQKSPEFSAVVSAQLLGSAPDTKNLELLGVQRYLIRSRDVGGTAAELTAHLLRAHAGLRATPKPDGSVQIDVDALPSLDEDLAQAAARLKIEIKAGTPLQITIQPP